MKKSLEKFDFLKKNQNKRILVRETKKIDENALDGVVVDSAGRFWIVEPRAFFDDGVSNPCKCVIAGSVRRKEDNLSLLTIGDFVKYKVEDLAIGESIAKGSILAVEERKTFLSRGEIHYAVKERAIAANFDQLLIIGSVDNPPYNKRLFDRLLLAAEFGNMKVAICINKIDLFDKLTAFKRDLKIYKSLEVELMWISAETKEGFPKLKKYLKNKRTVLIGFSGAGKSTIVNSLLDSEEQKTGEISEKWNRGKHTTSSSKIFKLGFGGFIADTPGIREFAIKNIDKELLSLYFKDIAKYAYDCKYLPCTHTHEPKCRVIEAVEKGEIDVERYQSYLNIFDSADGEIKR